MLVIKVSTSPDITHDTVAKHLEASIKGSPASFDDSTLSSISDLAKIRKAYKLTTPAPKPRKGEQTNSSNMPDEQNPTRTLERSIIGAIALRGAV
jgi:EKC/KEOPS complex subunit CGI121/TPRKB